ncbi:MAG: radical SAM protein [Syntrophobacter sp.]
MSFIFGPVPSRRLGRSLGIDVIPPKTCTFDCTYCESGPTTHLSTKRVMFADPLEVLKQLDEFFRRSPDGADAITFSSAGEPTLYLGLGELIRAIKARHPNIPLVVLTNGCLLRDAAVREDLSKADRVVPSLDAATPETFSTINRPHPSLHLPEILEGLKAFRRDFKNRFHLEIMLASGVNDTPEELAAIAREVAKIAPDRIELNTVVRPPARAGVKGLSPAAMEHAASFFPAGITDIIGTFGGRPRGDSSSGLSERILQTVERRPCTIPELAASLGVPENTLEAESGTLLAQKRLTMLSFDGQSFLCLPERSTSSRK